MDVMHIPLATESMADQWEAIRDLDEKENWIERTAVLSREDHHQLLQCAKVRGGVCSMVSLLMIVSLLTGDPY